MKVNLTNKHTFLYACLFCSFLLLQHCWAGAYYTDADLKQLGQRWVEVRSQWQQLRTNHSNNVAKINADPNLKPVQKQKLLELESHVFQSKSKGLAIRRDTVQRAIINETNARMGKPNKPPAEFNVNEGARQTAGTDVYDPAHRGMQGDLDAQAGSNTIEKMKGVMEDMGIAEFRKPGDPPVRMEDGSLRITTDDSIIQIKESAGVIDMGSDFEFTANKSGMQAQPGSEYHRVQTQVNAEHKESYISESMKNRAGDGTITSQQAGADYVTVQDHKKKAIKGLKSDGAKLAGDPDTMQSMVKGGNKTLRDAKISDDELAAILKKNNIPDSPAEFRNKMNQIKEGKLTVTDPSDAANMRNVQEGIFEVGEAKTLRTGRNEIADLKSRIKAAEAAGDVATSRKLRGELVDSRVKMQESNLANKKKLGQSRTKVDVDVDGPNGPKTLPDTPMTTRQKVVNTVGVVMTVADIGNACKTLEDYNAGKISGAEALEVLADSTITLGMIGTVKRIDKSASDWWEASKIIHKANKTNLANYFQDWELSLRKAGVSKEDARRMVEDAMGSGDTSSLEWKAEQLRLDGRRIDNPVLHIDHVESDDWPWERAYDVGEGIVVNTYNGVKYIVTAPYRIVSAYADYRAGVPDADLALQTADQVAWMKMKLFKKLKSYGIPSREALEAIHDFYDGTDPVALRKIFQEIRKRRGYVSAQQHQRDWYCTNRPKIESQAAIPPIVRSGNMVAPVGID